MLCRKDIRILVADDDKAVIRLLRLALATKGWKVYSCEAGDAIRGEISRCHPDLIVLDLKLPRKSGFQVLNELRKNSSIPIIILSGYLDSEIEIKCLTNGADDCISKPFDVELLAARLKAVMRRHEKNGSRGKPTIVTNNGLSIDLDRRLVTIDRKELRLTPIEYSLLSELALNKGKVLTHSHLLRKVWGTEYTNDTSYLHVCMSHLRTKVDRQISNRRHIVNVWGVGYKFQ